MSNDTSFIAKLHDLESKIGIHRVEFNSINSSLNEFKRQLDQFRSNDYISSERYNQNHTGFIKEIETIKDLIDSLTYKHTQLNGYYCNLFQELATQSEKLDTDVESLSKFNISFSDLKQEMVNKVSNCEEALRSFVLDVKNELVCRINFIKQEFISSPKSVVESNHDVAKKVEMAQLDCQNAMLKLGNLETQCRIFDRRLENLDIRIKKIELAKQE
jgi:hypothetical protein